MTPQDPARPAAAAAGADQSSLVMLLTQEGAANEAADAPQGPKAKQAAPQTGSDGYFARTLMMTRREMIHGMANRLLYSHFYKWLYMVMCVLSIVSLIMSVMAPCPGVWFLVLESIVNMAMIVEVTIRVLALGRLYWKSVWNFFDILIVMLCVVTMVSLFFTQCSTERSNEAILDTGLLVVRNGIQLGRLLSLTRRNRRSNMTAAPAKVDFSTLPPHGRWQRRHSSFASLAAADVPYALADGAAGSASQELGLVRIDGDSSAAGAPAAPVPAASAGDAVGSTAVQRPGGSVAVSRTSPQLGARGGAR